MRGFDEEWDRMVQKKDLFTDDPKNQMAVMAGLYHARLEELERWINQLPDKLDDLDNVRDVEYTIHRMKQMVNEEW